MARAEPLTGVGPFQWNVHRYVLDPKGPVIVVDAHNSYLQIAAEYGLVTLAVYGALLAHAMLIIGLSVLRRERRARIGWAGIGICVAAFTYPFAELTNSHFFNVRLGAVGWLLIATAVTLVAGRASALHGAPEGRLAPKPV
jgi:O-antigen ligase